MRRIAALALLTLAAVPEPPGYRMDHYRAPVPATLQGARVIGTEALARLIAETHPVLIDVLPAPAPPPDARPAMPRLPLPHRDIPGSVWLPDVGRGELPPGLAFSFKAALARLSEGRRDAAMVFYCLSQCWMSWNAAKRAVAEGFTHVIWYPDGADGWEKAGHPTSAAVPATMRP